MIEERTRERMHPGMPIGEARAVLDRLGLAYEGGWGAGRLMKEVYDEKVQHDVVGPVFCIDYPREVSPLARVHRDDQAYVERFELIVAGFELCNAYSEQNDPVEQLAAFEAEARAKQGGDPETRMDRLDQREGVLDPFWLPVAGHVVSVVVGLLLLVLADQLRRRKHSAWRVAAVLYAVGAIAHVLKGPHPASATLVAQLNAISARWRGKRPERGFTMSLSLDVVGVGANPEFLLCVALDERGVPGGFLRVVPAYGASFGYTLDLMRHDPDAPNGMTEFLIASTAETLRGRGVARLSMNFAMWGRLFADDVPFTARQRVARRVVGLLNPFFQIRSLRDFNARFGPEWLPRVLAYRRRADLPRVGLLYAGAEGFLSVPGLGELLVPKAVGGVSRPSAPPRSRPAVDHPAT